MIHKIIRFIQKIFTTIALLAGFYPIGWLFKHGSSIAFDFGITFSIIIIYGIWAIWRKDEQTT